MGQRLSVFWKTEDVNRPSLSEKPYPVLKRILQHVLNSEGSAGLRCRLVSQSLNDAMLMNLRLYLHYRISLETNKCEISLAQRRRSMRAVKFISTDQLINSRLVERIFTVEIRTWIDGNWDQQDLIKLASELSRPVEVRLYARYAPLPRVPNAPPPSFQLPILPMAQMSQMRVVKIVRHPGNYDLTEAELNLLANLHHLSELEMSSANLLQINNHIDRSKISQLVIHCDWEFEDPSDWDAVGQLYPNVHKLEVHCDNLLDRVNIFDVSFLRSFSHLHRLLIENSVSLDPASFLYVDLPQLVECHISLMLYYKEDRPKRLFTQMASAMPNLKKFNCFLVIELQYPVAVVDRVVTAYVASMVQFCPATVEELNLHIFATWDELKLTPFKYHRHLNALFTAVLNSRLTRVLVETYLEPIDYDLDANPFQYRKSRNGVQVGQPVKTTKMFAGIAGLLRQRQDPLHKYLLKKRNGQICTLDIIYLGQR